MGWRGAGPAAWRQINLRKATKPCHHGFPWIPHGPGDPINPFIWCAVGAAIGWLASQLAENKGGATGRIESILVGVFGAFIGGEFVASMFATPAPVVATVLGAVAAPIPSTPFTMMALVLAAAGSVVMLILLAVMRKAVGPMQQHKRKPNRNY